VEKGSPDILSALLRRGGDPNAIALQENSKGNTPLHFACLLAKQKHTELLLEYGANPFAENQFGQTPLQLLPVDEVRSTKLYFKKIFEEAGAKKLKEIKVSENENSLKSDEL
jgi:ankyrin repeat protein